MLIDSATSAEPGTTPLSAVMRYKASLTVASKSSGIIPLRAHQWRRGEKHIALIDIGQLDPFAQLGKVSFAQPQDAQLDVFQFASRCFALEGNRPSASLIHDFFDEAMLLDRKLFADFVNDGGCQSNRFRFARRAIERFLGLLKLVLGSAHLFA